MPMYAERDIVLQFCLTVCPSVCLSNVGSASHQICWYGNTYGAGAYFYGVSHPRSKGPHAASPIFATVLRIRLNGLTYTAT